MTLVDTLCQNLTSGSLKRSLWKQLREAPLLINPTSGKITGWFGGLVFFFLLGVKSRSYIEPRFNQELLLSVLEPRGSAFCITASAE